MKPAVHHEALIDELVKLLNVRGFPAESYDDVPRNLRIGNSDSLNACLWKIQPQANAWPDAVESAWGQKLPNLFQSLVKRYCFLGFKFGPLALFDNTGDGRRSNEFSRRVLADDGLLEVLRPNGLLHFAEPHYGSYDPVCFDTKRRGGAGDCPIVQVDHEQILCNHRLKIVAELAPSFR